ncbi:4Fe-4S binding protein [Paraclostridium bifermentans]|nr:4Fe-4S binding protein [Paraclostridium bifermentans]
MEKGKLTIDTNWCKGCGICVEYCPKKVFKIREQYNLCRRYRKMYTLWIM